MQNQEPAVMWPIELGQDGVVGKNHFKFAWNLSRCAKTWVKKKKDPLSLVMGIRESLFGMISPGEEVVLVSEWKVRVLLTSLHFLQYLFS